eukprot:Gb_23115 [translate_table: standard]
MVGNWQDEAGAAAMKTIELDAALGGRAVQHRETQGYETDKFLSYFKPCIIPQQDGVASGFKHDDGKDHQIRLFACKGNHAVRVKEASMLVSTEIGSVTRFLNAVGWVPKLILGSQVPYSRSSLNHDDVFILDTESKIFQFNGSNSSIQERAKALGVVQYIKDNYHAGKCEVAAIEDGKFVADPETGEFWSFFGGFAPLAKKLNSDDDSKFEALPGKLFCIQQGHVKSIESNVLKREMLDTKCCYMLDCGIEIFVWIGRNTSLDERKKASSAVEELIASEGRSDKTHVTLLIEGFETVIFRSNFDTWPQNTDITSSEEGRGKVAALLKRQGFNVKGLLKAAPAKEDHQAFLDCTGNLQVWRINGNTKIAVPASEQCKLYTGDCFIVQYTYPGEEKEEYLLFAWLGQHTISVPVSFGGNITDYTSKFYLVLAICRAKFEE